MEWWVVIFFLMGGLLFFLAMGLPIAFSFLLINFGYIRICEQVKMK